MSRLTAEQIDALAIEGLNVVTGARGTVAYDYDITGYRRVPRRDTAFGKFAAWDFQSTPAAHPGSHPECGLDRAYHIRLGGFERGRIYTADQIGQLLRAHHVFCSDGPGNGKYESLMIARKYGLRPVFEAAAWNLRLPVTRRQLAAFEPQCEAQVRSMREFCRRMGKSLGMDLVNDPEAMWVALVGVDVQPLDVFLGQLDDNYDQVNADFREEYGYDLPLEASPASPQNTARRIQLWEYIRRRYSELALLQNNVVRRHLRGLIVGNLEFDTEPDYGIWGQAYDVPGFNLRTTLFEDEIGYRYWVGYGTRLSRDLTRRPPMISIRTNQVAAGPRVVPSREATRYWYSQAIQNGAGGFYLWIKDFAGDRNDPNAYSGPCMMNPDPSTRPAERWQTHLEAAQELGQTRVFQPPRAEAGILVSIPSCAAGGWPAVFSAFVETARARVFARFISSAELRSGDEPLSGLRLLFAPAALFEHRSVIGRLEAAVRQGLTLVIADPTSFAYDEFGETNEPGQKLLGLQKALPRKEAEAVCLRQDGKTFEFASYRPGWSLEPTDGATVVGHFRDGTAAALEQRLGLGRSITLGAPLLDLYTSGIRDLSREEPARYALLQHWRRQSGAADHAWMFDVTLENLRDVTGPIPPPLREMDPSVEFAPFLYVHGAEMTGL